MSGARRWSIKRGWIVAAVGFGMSMSACARSGSERLEAGFDEIPSTVNTVTPLTSSLAEDTAVASSAVESPVPTAGAPIVPVEGTALLDDPAINCGNGLAAELMLLDESTGSILWQRPSSHSMNSEIAVVDVDGNPVIVAGTTGVDGDGTGGFAADLLTGAEIWQDNDGANGFGTNIVGEVMLELVYDGSGSMVRARSTADGRELWRHDGYLLPYPDYRQPDSLSGDLIFISGWPTTNAIVAVDAATGDARWTTPLDGEPQLWFHGDGIYALYGDGIHTNAGSATAARLDAATGDFVWEQDLELDGTVTETRISDEAVVLMTRRPDGFIGSYHAYSAATGEPLGAGPLPGDTVNVALTASGIVTSGQSYDVYGETSSARLTDLHTGGIVWERPAPSTAGIATTPWGVVFERRGDNDATIVDLLDDTGDLVWSWTSPPAMQVAALSTGATSLLVSLSSSVDTPGSRGGAVALDPAAGSPRWQLLTDLPVEQPALITSAGVVIEQRQPLLFCD